MLDLLNGLEEGPNQIYDDIGLDAKLQYIVIWMRSVDTRQILSVIPLRKDRTNCNSIPGLRDLRNRKVLINVRVLRESTTMDLAHVWPSKIGVRPLGF